jgi:heat shock protein HslJ
MADDPPASPDDAAGNDQETTPVGPPEKMSPAFYASLALIGILVVMVVLLNYPGAQANAGIMITQSNWTLQSLTDSTGILIPARSGTEVTARFSRDQGRMSGNAGCNWYSDIYTTKDFAINLTPESITDMRCWDPGVAEQESAFIADLSKASSFRFSGSALKFYDASGKTVLVFVPG